MDGKMTVRPAEGNDKPLTNWKNEPTLVALKRDLEQAKGAHGAQMSQIDKWNDLMNVRGSAAVPKIQGRSSVQPKLIRRQAEWRYAALTEPFLGSNKLFKVSPVTFEDEEAAKQNELVLNWQFRTQMNRVQFIDNFIRATVDEGTSICQLGWRRSTVMIDKQVPTWDHLPITTEQELQAFQQALQLKQQSPRDYEEKLDESYKAAVDLYEETGQATVAIQSGWATIQEEKVLENGPTAQILNPRNFILDPSCNGDFDKALFAIVSFETNKSELMKYGKRYKNLDQVNWEGNTPIMEPDHETRTPGEWNFNDKSRKKVVAYEYWGFYDIEDDEKLVPFVATWIGDTMIRMELNPFPDGKLPFVMVPYLPVKRDVYGQPDAELLEDNQKILGATVRGMIDLLGRSANGQKGMAKGMLDAVNKRRFDNGQDYEYNPTGNPQAQFIEHKYPELPNSALQMLTLQNQEAESLTGVKAFSGGVSGEAYGDVAAGIRGALDAASKREMAILRRLAKGMTEIGQKIIAMNSEFLSEKEVIRVTNREYVEISREDLQGNFDLEVDISTAEIDNTKAQDLGFMLQTIGPNMDPQIFMTILAEIAELKRMPPLAEKLRNWKPQPTPEQEKLAQLEVAKAEAEVRKIESEIALNQAKAEEARTNKDLNNLKYVEQETGTTHEREMEKQRGQAQGNQDLEVTKALLKPRKQANGAESKPQLEEAIGFNGISDKLRKVQNDRPGMTSTLDRNVAAAADPRLSIGSQEFVPSMDPALNPAMTIS